MSGLRAIHVLNALVIGATALSACDRSPPPSAPPPVAPAPPAPAAEVAPPPPPPPPESGLAIKRGMVNLVQDHYLFQPCSASSRWSVQGTEVVEALKQYPADSSHAVFLEARGEFSQPGALTGTAGDLVVQELLYVAPTSEHAACATATSQYKVWAGGNEPSWSAQIRGDTMILTQPEIAQREFKLADSADAEGAVVYRATAPDAQVELTVTQQPCRNAAGEYFGFSARATFGEQHLEGCARPGE